MTANQSDVSFPALAVINVTMSPLEFFGLAPLTGKLNVSPVGSTLEAKLNDYRGLGRLSISGSYPPAQFVSKFMGHAFALNGNVASFGLSASSLNALVQFINDVDALFPALFSSAFHAPIDVEDISGSLQGFEFTVKSSLSISNSTLCTPTTLPLKEHFDEHSPNSFPEIFLVSALRYLQQADRLNAEGRHLTTFLAERILNIAKALEAIFSENVDTMRKELAVLNVESTYVAIFASVKYLRNQVDVGHVSFSDLPNGSVQDIFAFTELATSCLRSLILLIMEDGEAQARLAKLRSNTNVVKVPDAVAYIRHYRNVLPPKDGKLNVLHKNAN